MKRWLSRRTVVGVAWSLIGLGVIPLVYLLIWTSTHNSQPVAERILLQRGQFVSNYFKPELDGTYQVSISWLNQFPSPATQVNLDWKIVDSQNRLIDQGTYNGALNGANIVQLGTYQPQRGVRQRIVVDVHQDVSGPDQEARLEIGIPEVGLDMAEGAYPLAMVWAATTAIPGMIVLAVVWFWRRFSPKS